MSLWSCNRARVAALALGSAIGLASSEPVAAQVVRGLVTEKTTNAPLDGVVLTVLDPRDTVVVQALSNDGGGFEIRLPSPGMYTLDVKRVDVVLEPVPTVLSSVNVMGRTSCVRNPQTNAKTAALWEDARAALTASV